MKIDDFDFSETWKPVGKDKELFFSIPSNFSQNNLVKKFTVRLKTFKNVLTLGGDGFNILFYNKEPIKDGDFLHLMLDLPKDDIGVIFFNVDDKQQGVEINVALRDELIAIIEKSGLDVMEIDRYGMDLGIEDDEVQEDDYSEAEKEHLDTLEYNKRRKNNTNKKDKSHNEDNLHDNFVIPEVEVLPNDIGKDILSNVISLNTLTTEQSNILNNFMEEFSKKKMQSITLISGCLQISGMNKTKDIISCSIITLKGKLKISISIDSNSLELNCSKDFSEWLQDFLKVHSKNKSFLG
jgi:hypothetical protein